ncbi:YxeA family protein [Peribacillus sp. SI8-4]|uniref:YxeA family protein n=1 Tax=Peribacillus sp. SI8-4 TaxID=3048009 RepID=UPI002556A4DC|nr:YxeA family protein [Peribacillus sp. SI8-4]
MKKFFTVAGIIFLIGAAGAFALTKIDFNRMNADHYYVQITEDGTKHEQKVEDGSLMTSYSYRLDGTNAEGKTKPLEFTAQKNLRKDAYLKVYVKDEDKVSSYDEVKFEEIPKKAQDKLK